MTALQSHDHQALCETFPDFQAFLQLGITWTFCIPAKCPGDVDKQPLWVTKCEPSTHGHCIECLLPLQPNCLGQCMTLNHDWPPSYYKKEMCKRLNPLKA